MKNIYPRQFLLLFFLLQLIVVSVFKNMIVAPMDRVFFLTIVAVALYIFFTPKKFHLDCWIVFAFVCLTFYFSLRSFPQYSRLYSELIALRIISISGGMAGYLIIRQYKVYDVYAVLKVATILLLAYYSLKLTTFTADSESEGSMNLSYGLLIASISSLAFALNEKKRFWYYIAGICFIETLILGSRGPFLCYITFLVFYYLFIKSQNLSTLKKVSVLLLSSLIIFFLVSNLDVISSFLGSKLGIIGGTRIVEKMNSGELGDDTGRSVIWLRTLDMIGNEPFHAYGALADQFNFELFSHNIVLELMLTYGMVPGLFFSIGIIILALYVLIPYRNIIDKLVFLILFSCSIPRLCVSNSFWYDQNFWMMLGIGITIMLSSKNSEKKILEYK